MRHSNFNIRYLFIVDFQERGLQHKVGVLSLLEQLEQVQEGSKDQPMIFVLRVWFPIELQDSNFKINSVELNTPLRPSLTSSGGPVNVWVFPEPVCP